MHSQTGHINHQNRLGHIEQTGTKGAKGCSQNKNWAHKNHSNNRSTGQDKSEQNQGSPTKITILVWRSIQRGRTKPEHTGRSSKAWTACWQTFIAFEEVKEHRNHQNCLYKPNYTILGKNTQFAGERLGSRPKTDSRHGQEQSNEHGPKICIQKARIHQNRPLYRPDGKVILRTKHGSMFFKQVKFHYIWMTRRCQKSPKSPVQPPDTDFGKNK